MVIMQSARQVIRIYGSDPGHDDHDHEDEYDDQDHDDHPKECSSSDELIMMPMATMMVLRCASISTGKLGSLRASLLDLFGSR